MTFTEAVRLLEDAGIAEAACEARILFSTLGGIPAHRLYTENPICVSPRLDHALARRMTREPLAYILGEVSFFRETYLVSPDVLIPRPDTEVLVEAAIKQLPHGALFYDFCTGSGCIAISILASRPDCTAVGFDISAAALALAQKNAVLNGVSHRLTLRCADLLVEKVDISHVSAVLSNPPYIAESERTDLAPELSFEPQNALFADEDGLCFYRHFLDTYAPSLSPNAFFLFEIGHTQKASLARLAQKNGLSASFIRDLGGHDRVAFCHL